MGVNQERCLALLVGDLAGRVFPMRDPGNVFFFIVYIKIIGRPGAVR